MRRKRKWLIVICVLLVLITISQILKHFNYGTESKEAYNTYTVEKERQLDLQGKAYPREVKTYYKNNQVGTYLGVQVADGQTVKKGDKVNLSITSTGKTGAGIIKQISELPISYEENLSLHENDALHLPESNNDGELANSKSISASPIFKSNNNSELSKYGVIIDDLSLPIRAGYSLEIKIPLNAIKIPKSVLTKGNNVFIVNKNSIVEKRNIRIKRINGDIIVEKGLKPGDKLIKQPKSTMNDGDKVEISS
ncbi:TPA: RND transporter [Staphylococcus aureus]